MKRFSIYILLLLASGLFFTACDNEDDDPKPQDTTNKVSMMMHYYYGDQMLDTSKTYTLTDAGGNDATIDFAFVSFIISDLSVVYDDGTEQALAETYKVADAHEGAMETLSFGQHTLEDKTVSGLKFHIGLNPTLNGIDPISELSEGDELYRPDMHWGWNPAAGYKFIRVEGDYTFASDPDSTRSITYHIATDPYFTESTTLVNVAPEVMENGDLMWHVKADVKGVFNNIDLSTEDFTMTGTDVVDITNKVSANVNDNVFSAQN